jgi:hypothetical protein
MWPYRNRCCKPDAVVAVEHGVLALVELEQGAEEEWHQAQRHVGVTDGTSERPPGRPVHVVMRPVPVVDRRCGRVHAVALHREPRRGTQRATLECQDFLRAQYLHAIGLDTHGDLLTELALRPRCPCGEPATFGVGIILDGGQPARPTEFVRAVVRPGSVGLAAA